MTNRKFSLQGPTHIKRAATDKLREVFIKYASQEVQGERFMTSEDFVRQYLGLFPEANHNKVSVTLPLTSAQCSLLRKVLIGCSSIHIYKYKIALSKAF